MAQKGDTMINKIITSLNLLDNIAPPDQINVKVEVAKAGFSQQDSAIDTLRKLIDGKLIAEAMCDSNTCDTIACDTICDGICDGICDAICDAICDVICDKVCDEICDKVSDKSTIA